MQRRCTVDKDRDLKLCRCALDPVCIGRKAPRDHRNVTVGAALLAHKVVDIKAELEKIREQIQNIE